MGATVPYRTEIPYYGTNQYGPSSSVGVVRLALGACTVLPWPVARAYDRLPVYTTQ